MNNIKKIRKEKNINVTTLATAIGISQSNLTKIENNQIELKHDIAQKIAQYMNVSLTAITNTKEEGVELINPEVYNLPNHSRWNIPPHISISPTTKGYIIPDDTMQPTFHKYSIATIDNIKTPITNGVYLISYNHQIILRRIQIIDNQNIKIITDNASYPPIQTSLTNIEIIGQSTYIISTQKID